MIKKLFILLIFVTNGCYCFFYNDTPVIESLKSGNIYFKNYYNPFLNQTTDFLRTLYKNNEINPGCKSSLKRWIDGIEQSEVWALKFLEATGKTMNSKLIGGNVNYGFFDYCVGFTKNEKEKIDFDGKYCLLSVHAADAKAVKNSKVFKDNLALLSDNSKIISNFVIGDYYGICIPSTCQIEELLPIFNELFKPELEIFALSEGKTITEPETLTNIQIFAFVFLSILFGLCILSCFIKNKFISNFSLVDNFKIIYQYDPNNNTNKISAFLHGTKFLLVYISIFVHIFVVNSLIYPHPYSLIKEFFKPPEYVKIYVNKFLVTSDAMFFFGGFFAMFAWHDVVKSGKIKYNFKNFFILRYIKISIIAAIVILITMLLPHLGSGPVYVDYSKYLYNNCKESWWYIFLLISNNQNCLDMCIVPSWYLSSDFQIYIMNYFLIYYLIKKPKLGFFLAFIQCFVVSTFNLIYVNYYNLPTSVNLLDIVFFDLSFMRHVHFATLIHYNTYVIGLICAWLVKNEVKAKFLNSKPIYLIVNGLAFSAFYLFLLYLNYLENSGIKLNRFIEILLPVIERFFCIIPFFWFFYSCCLGYNEIIREMLSLRAFVPWSRLSFSLILGQFLYFYYLAGNIRQLILFDKLSILKEMISAYFFIFIIGNVIFLFFEQPIFNLFQNYMGIKKRSEISSMRNQNGLSDDKKSL